MCVLTVKKQRKAFSAVTRVPEARKKTGSPMLCRDLKEVRRVPRFGRAVKFDANSYCSLRVEGVDTYSVHVLS